MLGHSGVDGGRIGVTQMLLNEAYIVPGPPMQLYATHVTERMRVSLGEAGPTTKGLDELPDPLAAGGPCAAADNGAECSLARGARRCARRW